MLYGLLFWDIIFADVPGAFETPYQSAPLDIADDTFYYARQELIDERLHELKEEGRARDIVASIDAEHREKGTWCVGVRWDAFERDDLLDIVDVRIVLGGVLALTQLEFTVFQRERSRDYLPALCRRLRKPYCRDARLVHLERHRENLQVRRGQGAARCAFGKTEGLPVAMLCHNAF